MANPDRRQSWRSKGRLAAGLAVAAGLVGLAYLPVWRLTATLEDAVADRDRQLVLFEVLHGKNLARQAQRDYFLGADAARLAQREQGLGHLELHLEILRGMARAPAERAAAKRLKAQAAAWRRALDAELRGADAGGRAGEALRTTDRADAVVEETAAAIAHAAREQVEKRSVAARRHSAFALLGFFGLLVGGGVFAAFHSHRLRREIAARASAQRALAAANDGLEAKIAERTADLRGEVARHATTEARLRRANRALEVIARANAVLGQARDEAALYAAVCRALVDSGGYRLCWVGAPEHDADKRIRPLAQAVFAATPAELPELRWDAASDAGCPVGRALRSGRPEFVRDALHDEAFARWRGHAERLGYASVAALPIVVAGEVVGGLNVHAADADAFDADEVSLLAQLAGDIALAVGALRAEDALARAGEQVSLMLATLPLVLYSGRADGDYAATFVSANVEAVTGFAAAEFVGKPEFWAGRIHADDRPQVLARRSAMSGDGSLAQEYRWRVGDGTYRWFYDVARVVRAADGSPLRLVGAWLDVSARKATERALAHAKVELETALEATRRKNALLVEANRTRSEFLATMSHELKTPLNAIIGFSELLRDGLAGPVSDEQRGFLDDIFAAGGELLEVLTAILDFARLDAGQGSFVPEAVDAAWFDAVAQPWRQRATTAGLAFTLEIAADLGEPLVDAAMLRQIIDKLLANAIKFTPAGTVQMSVRRVAREAAPADLAGDIKACLELAVADTGIGIAAAVMPRLFEPFHQADASLARAYEGIGLGLATVRRLVERHGGAVRADSVPGQGTRLTVWLPWRETTTPAPPAVPAVGGSAPLALIVEEDPRAADLIRRQLEGEGLRTAIAPSAETALAMAVELRPALITLDILLPGIDGWEFLARLKADARTAAIPVIVALKADAATAHIPIIVVTGADLGDAERTRLGTQVVSVVSKAQFDADGFLGEVRRALRRGA